MPTGLDQAAKAVITKVPQEGGLIPDVQAFLRIAATAAGVAEASGEGAAAVAAAETAATAATGFSILPIIVGFLVVLLLLRFVEGLLINLAGLIPFKGPDAKNVVRGAFRWLDNLENSVLGWLGAEVQTLLKAVVHLVGWCVTQLGFFIPGSQPAPSAQPGQTATKQDVYHLQSQINQLRAEVSSLNYALTPSTFPVGTPAPAPAPAPGVTNVTRVVTVGVPEKVWDELHALQDSQAQFRSELNALRTELSRTTAMSTRTAQEQIQLSQSIHAIRAVATGWQDVENQLHNLGALLTAYSDQVDAELQRQDAVQRQMAPLGLLLAPGIPGLKTLRQLEDTPCMCPKLPRIPRAMPELLGMYEFISNG